MIELSLYVYPLSTIPTEWNGVILRGSMDGRPPERPSVMTRQREQTADHKSANFDKRMHKISSSSNYHPNRQSPRLSFSRSEIRIEYIRKFIRDDYLASGDR